jgi:hypothetical protein
MVPPSSVYHIYVCYDINATLEHFPSLYGGYRDIIISAGSGVRLTI